MLFRVCPRCLFSMVSGVRGMPVCTVSMVGRLLVTPCLVVLARFGVMPRSVGRMFRRPLMMFRSLLGHDDSSETDIRRHQLLAPDPRNWQEHGLAGVHQWVELWTVVLCGLNYGGICKNDPYPPALTSNNDLCHKNEIVFVVGASAPGTTCLCKVLQRDPPPARHSIGHVIVRFDASAPALRRHDTSHSRRTSSPITPGSSFRYTQAERATERPSRLQTGAGSVGKSAWVDNVLALLLQISTSSPTSTTRASGRR